MTTKTNVNGGVGPNWCLAQLLNALGIDYFYCVGKIKGPYKNLGPRFPFNICNRTLVDNNGDPLLFKDQSTETQEAITKIILNK